MSECRGVGHTLVTGQPESLVKNGEIVMDGGIDPNGPISVREVRKALLQFHDNDRIVIRVMSNGGSADEATRIYLLLREQEKPITVHIERAVSAAALIAVAASHVTIVSGGTLMLHSPSWIVAESLTAIQLRVRADMLDQVEASLVDAFARKTGLAREALQKMLVEETWLSAERAVELGFADEVLSRPSDDSCPLLHCPARKM